MAAETEKGGRELSRWALAKGREYGGHLPVALEGWVHRVNTRVCCIPWLFHARVGVEHLLLTAFYDLKNKVIEDRC